MSDSAPRRSLRPVPASADPRAASDPLTRPLAVDQRAAIRLARLPWDLPTGSGKLRVRGALRSDLPALARMHGRCSGDTLLQRYQRGGLPPALPTLDELLRSPLVVVVQTPSGAVVAMANASRPATAPGCAPEPTWVTQLGLVVEDGWQQLGIGRRL